MTEERGGNVLSVYDLVDAALASDPSALQRALTMMAPADAVQFYRDECKKNGVGPIQTFCRQIHSNAAFLDFSNNYFGERGILPVLATIQHLAVVEVRFRKCDLSAEDICRVHAALASHPTLTSLDFRGNLLSLPSSRKLLSLAIHNKRITTLVVDDNVPKCILIQRQCLANANIAVHTSACVMCQKSMVHSMTGNVESKVFVAFDERLSGRMETLTVAEIETLFRCLLAMADVNDGVLFLCTIECINAFTADVLEAMRMVVNEVHLNIRHAHHRHPVLAKCVMELLEGFNAEKLPTHYFVQDAEACQRRDAPTESDWSVCSVCGRSCVPLLDGAALIMRMVCHDVKHGAVIRPSALLRLIHTVLKYARMAPCGRKCVRHIVRFGILGYGGVIRSNPDPSDPLLSSLDIPLKHLPDEDFCVVNFAETVVLDNGEEDTTCAVTVASAMADIDMIPVDPYCIFAVGRHLAKRGTTVFGMELRHACEAVRVVGCLPVDRAPFLRKNRPPRSSYVDWQKWNAVTDVQQLQRVCFARRRQGVYVIDGNADNSFDKIRAALWAFKEQQRCAVVTLKFCLAWMQADKGIIRSDMPPRGGFYTAVKILGQTMVHNSLHLIVQCNFGVSVGNRGFFYVPRSIFNRSVRGAAYFFIDTTAIRENQGMEPPQHFLGMVSKEVLGVLERPSLVYDVVRFLGNANQRQVDAAHIQKLQGCLATMPPSLFLALLIPGIRIPHEYAKRRRLIVRLFENSRGKTQLAYLWNEILGSSAASWIDKASETLCAVIREKRGATPVTSAASAVASESEQVDWRTSPCVEAGKVSCKGTAFGEASTPSTASLVSAAPPMPRPPKQEKSAPSHAPSHHSNAAPIDPFKADMLQSLRDQREEQSASLKQAKSRSLSSWDPAALGYEPTPVTTYMADDVPSDILPLELMCARWSAVNIQDEFGQATARTLFFIKHYLCEYDCEDKRVTKPLRQMSNDEAYSRFPFSTGFDCAFQVSARKKPEVYFFSEQSWVVWDVCRKLCVTGPHPTRVHRMFRALPPEYHDRIDSAVEVIGTHHVMLFSQSNFVVYDVANSCVLQQTKSFRDPSLVGFPAQLASVFPHAPMAAFSWGKTCDGSSSTRYHSRDSRLIIIGFDGRTWTPPNAAFKRGFRGDFVPNECEVDAVAICHSPLAGLPAAFLQSSSLSGSSIVDALLDFVPRNKLCNLTPYVLRQHTADDGMSSSMMNASASLLGGSVAALDGLRVSALKERLIVSTTLDVTGSETEALVKCFCESDVQNPKLLRDTAILRYRAPRAADTLRDNDGQAVGSPTSTAHQYIDFELSDATAFAYTQLFLDTSCMDERILLVAPLRVSIQCSADGVCYTEVTVGMVSSAVAGAYWSPVHHAHFWRLRFLDELPDGIGIVKVLWYRAQWVIDSSPYELTETFLHSSSAEVWLDADVLFSPASDLLVDIAPQPVFSVPRNDTWYPRHAVLPLLTNRNGDSALFFCGDVFLEFDFIDDTVVSNRCVALALHPAFAQLPFPFNGGFDAIFYPDIRDTAKVILLHDDKLLLWDILEGIPLGPIQTFHDSQYFKGLPFPVKRLNEVTNIWDYPGHVFVFSDSKVLRWNVLDACVVEGPFTREQIPVFDVPAFAQEPFLAVTSFPGEQSKTFFIFCKNEVVESTLRKDHKVTMKAPANFSTADFFSTVARYISWGEARHETSISFDFAESMPLALGLTMRSSDGCNPGTQWRVEFSDDNARWTQCAVHTQSVPRSSSSWHMNDVHGVSHRFWKLTTAAGTSAGSSLDTVVYSQVLFQVLAQTPLAVAPSRLSFNGDSCGSPSALLSGDFSLDCPAATAGRRYTLALDFGVSPVEVNGVSYASEDAAPSDMWCVSCSCDGESWQQAAEWRCTTACCQFSWAPLYPQRYWKIELTSSTKPKTFESFQMYENAAPSIVTNEGSDVRHFTGMLHPRQTSDATIDFKAHPGATISVDFKHFPQALVGIALAIDVDSFTFMTSFEVEYSSDARTWYSVGTLVSCDDLGNAAWASEGAHRFWRLRVSKHYGAKTIRVKRLAMSVGGAVLYRQYHRHVVESLPNCFALASGEQVEFVSVSADIPAKTAVAVQCSADGSGTNWTTVAVLNNSAAITTTCSAGWPLGVVSNLWRLLPVSRPNAEEEAHDTNAAAPCKISSVLWCGASRVASHFPAFTPEHFRLSLSDFVDEQTSPPMDPSDAGEVALRSAGPKPQVTWNFLGRRAALTSLVVRAAQLSTPDEIEVAIPTVLKPVAPATTTSEIVAPVTKASDSVVVHVEVSDDGMFFAPVAQATLVSDTVVVSWSRAVRSAYWRVSFTTAGSGTPTIFVSQLRWVFQTPASSFPNSSLQVVLSHYLHSLWARCSEQGENDLRSAAIEGLQQADSVATGLREPDDINDFGKMMQTLCNWQKAFQKHMVRRIKENRDVQTAQGITQPNGIDITLIMKTLATTQTDPRMSQMAALIGSRVVVQELKGVKESLSWCGPKAEYRGVLAQPLFGIAEANVSFAVRWLLSPQMLIRSEETLSRKEPLRPISSCITVTLSINKTDWFASAAFPQLPVLYEFNITERHTAVVFSSSELSFHPPQTTLVPPGGTPITSPHSYTIHAGVNFIATVRLRDCLCPALDKMTRFFGPAMLEKQTLVLLHVATLDSKTSTVRFSLDTKAISFAVPNLRVPTVTVEIVMDLGNPVVSHRRLVSFLSQDAVFDVGGVEIPMHVAGTLARDSSAIQLTARSLEGCLHNPLGMPKCELNNISFSCELSCSAEGPYTCFLPAVDVTGVLSTQCGLVFSARLSLSHLLLSGAGTMNILLQKCSFATLVRLAAFISNTAGRLAVEDWMSEVPMQITATLRAFPKQFSAKATGMVSFYGQSGLIAIFITPTGVHMSFKTPSLVIGGLEVIGSTATNGQVLVEAAAPLGGVATIRLDGLCKTLSRNPASSQIELSAAGTLCLSSGPYFDVCVRDDSLIPVGAYATVSVARDKFIEPLAQALKSTALVATLLSHGLPFSFSVHSVTVTNCALARQAVQLTFQGVLFGYRYDVTASVCAPENNAETVDAICEGLAAHIIEQCNESLWSSLDTFIGCVHELKSDGSDSDTDGNLQAPAQSSSPSSTTKRRASVSFANQEASTPFSLPSRAKQRQAKARQGTLMALWLEKECENLDEIIAKAITEF